MGLSTPYLHDVEHDKRRLVTGRWPALVAAIPGLDLRRLCEESIDAGPVEIDPAMLSASQREILVGVLMMAATRPATPPKRGRKGAKS